MIRSVNNEKVVIFYLKVKFFFRIRIYSSSLEGQAILIAGFVHLTIKGKVIHRGKWQNVIGYEENINQGAIQEDLSIMMDLHSSIHREEALEVAYTQGSDRDLKIVEADFFVQDYHIGNFYALMPNVYEKG